MPQIRFKNNLKVDTSREQREYQTQVVNQQKPVNTNQKLHKNLSPDFTPLLSPASPNFIEQKSKNISSPSSHHSTIMCEDDQENKHGVPINNNQIVKDARPD